MLTTILWMLLATIGATVGIGLLADWLLGLIAGKGEPRR